MTLLILIYQVYNRLSIYSAWLFTIATLGLGCFEAVICSSRSYSEARFFFYWEVWCELCVIPATKRHEDIQGEILEGLVARIVTPESLTILKEVLVQYPPPPVPEGKRCCLRFPNSI